jgi:hypothetical protein
LSPGWLVLSVLLSRVQPDIRAYIHQVVDVSRAVWFTLLS